MPQKLSHYQRLLQRMSLTPQMRQSIQILSMSVKDLGDYIDSVVTQNPFLQKLMDRKTARDYGKGPVSGAGAGEDFREYQKGAKEAPNPRLALLAQLRMSGREDKQAEKIAEYLIYEMDDNGYIDIDPEEAADNLAVRPEDVLGCIEAIQKMDPPGIGARDIRECLQLQLKRARKEDSLEYRIVTDCVNELARNDTERIAKTLKADEGKVREAVKAIKSLNPRPASTILAREEAKVVPELIAKVSRDKIRLEVNRNFIPQLKLYNPYESNLDIIKDGEARAFLKENMDAAKGLIDNLKRREETICKVATYILAFQRDALLNDKRELKTLTIKGVAEALDFHPSTISRAVSNKYIQVNDKVVSIVSLLSHGIRKENGEITSKTAIKDRIEKIVKHEDAAHPLSDDAIRERLAAEGIALKRRTIAKYRHLLRILPAHLRRKV